MLAVASKRSYEKETVLLEPVRSGAWLNMKGMGESSNVWSKQARGAL